MTYIPSLTKEELETLLSLRRCYGDRSPEQWHQCGSIQLPGKPKPSDCYPSLKGLVDKGVVEVHQQVEHRFQQNQLMIDAFVNFEIADDVDFEPTAEEWRAFKAEYEAENPPEVVPDEVNTYPCCWHTTYYYRFPVAH